MTYAEAVAILEREGVDMDEVMARLGPPPPLTPEQIVLLRRVFSAAVTPRGPEANSR